MIDPHALKDILALAAFVAWILAGLWSSRRDARSDVRRRRVNHFITLGVVISFAVGLTGRPAYPFYHWPVVAAVFPDSMGIHRFAGVDETGLEHDIDPRAWHPFNPTELPSWFVQYYPQLDSTSQRMVATYLVNLAETGRRRAAAGQPVGRFSRLLGPVAAPSFSLTRRIWTNPSTVPAAPIVALRWVRRTWNVETRARDPEAYREERLFELRPNQ